MKNHFESVVKRLLYIVLSLSLAMGIVSYAPVGSYAYQAANESGETYVGLPGEEPEDGAIPAEEVPGLTRIDSFTPVEFPQDGDEGDIVEDTKEEAAIVSEDNGKRDQYQKDFLLKDMSRLAVTYPEAVHFLDDDKWVDIDNTLELVTDEITGKEVYRNKANSVIMELPTVLDAENGPRISFEGKDLGFMFAGLAENKSAEIMEDPDSPELLLVSETPAVINNDLIPQEQICQEEEAVFSLVIML